MSAIGDLFLRLLIDDKGFAVDLNKKAGKAGDQAGKTLGSRMANSLKGTFGKKDVLGFIGLGAGIGVASLALAKMTSVMTDAVAAAIEEERSIAKLDTALRANVEGYDGNTEAIERVLAARMSLGFADDEQRESLALLIAATGDYNRALEIQRTAMDLSRLKGISLAAASEALIKVEAGSFRILKSLGIVLKEGATQTEALAAVQKVAAGQAESYAETTEGKLLVSQVKVGEALEKLGEKLLPVVTAAAEGAAEAVEALSVVFEDLHGALDDTNETVRSNENIWDNFLNILDDISERGNESKTAIGTIDEALSNFLDDAVDIITFWDSYTLAVEDQAKEAQESAEANREAGRGIGVAASAAKAAQEPIEELGIQGQRAGRKLQRAGHEAAESFKDWRDRVIGYARDIIDKAYQIVEDKAELTATNQEIRDLERIRSTRKWTSEEAARYTELTHRQVELVVNLAANGVKSGKLVNQSMAQLRKRLKTSVGEERAAIWAAIKLLRQLQRAADLAKIKSVAAAAAAAKGLGSSALIGGNWGFAEGGYRPAGVPSWVGEKGPELSVPLTPSLIIPNDLSMALTGGPGGVGNTYNVSVMAPTRPQSVREIGGDLRALGEMGHLPGSGR